MIRLKLKRISESRFITFGVILGIEGLPICLCLELPYKANQKSISCIPEGIYLCEKYSSAKYPEAVQVMDVPNRSYILIHSGNTTNDTSGCILPGLSFGIFQGKPAVLNSKDAFKKLVNYVNNKSFELNIKGG